MKLTKSQKIYLAGLGTAFCALVWDQTMTGNRTTPHPPAASVFTDSTILVRPVSDKPESAIKGASPGRAIGWLLHDLELGLPPLQNVRDAFVPSDNWHPDGGTVLSVDQQAADFIRSHHLKLVILRRSGSLAMVDNDLLSIGQHLDGFQLRSVNKLSAVFANDDTTIELHLAGTDSSASSTTDR